MLKEDFGNPFDNGYRLGRCYFHSSFCHHFDVASLWNEVIIPEENIHNRYNLFSIEFEEWACENIHTKWTYFNTNFERGSPIRKFYFEDNETAVLFKLTWG